MCSFCISQAGAPLLILDYMAGAMGVHLFNSLFQRFAKWYNTGNANKYADMSTWALVRMQPGTCTENQRERSDFECQVYHALERLFKCVCVCTCSWTRTCTLDRFRMETPLLLEGLFTNECHIYTSIAPSQALGLQGTSPGLFEGCCIWMELTMVEHNHGDPRQRQGDFRGGSQLCAPQIHQTSAVGARWTKDNSEKIPYQVHLILEVSPSWGQKFPQVVIFFCKDGPSSCSCYIALGCSWRN